LLNPILKKLQNHWYWNFITNWRTVPKSYWNLRRNKDKLNQLAA
jgi:hypothetical protein